MTNATKVSKQDKIIKALEAIKTLDDDTTQVAVKIEYKNDVPQEYILSGKTNNQVIQELPNGLLRVYEVAESTTESLDAGGYTTLTITGEYQDIKV